jgi:hypothetical protein
MRSWTAENFADDEPREPRAPQDRASWYAQGISDAIGDRLLMFDNSGGPSLELLRFSWKIVAFPGFEASLRERVELLSQFRHPSFSKIRAVEKLEPKNDLTLVSNYVSGKRLSDELAALRGPAFAMWFIREMVPALASLQQQGPRVAHGALTSDRIVLTAEGRLVVVEHVLGSALEHLQLSRNELWIRFGIGCPPTPMPGASVVLDSQADIFQLGLMALSVLLGRSIASYEYPQRLPELIDRFELTSGREVPSALRSWLARALHIEGKPFESARDAQDGLGELTSAQNPAELPGEVAPVPIVINQLEPSRQAMDTLVAQQLAQGPPRVREWPDSGSRPEEPGSPRTGSINKGRYTSGQRELVAADLLRAHRLEAAQNYPSRVNNLGAIALAVVSLLAVGQAAYIGYLLYKPQAIVIEAPKPVAVNLATNRVEVLPAVAPSPAADPKPQPTVPDLLVKPSASARSGGVRVISQIEVQLVDGDRVLGSNTDGPIVTSAGRHEFELVNNALGYRSKQVVNIKPGEIISVPIPHPEGRISINAVPWADVWIDRVHIGETPLANLAIPIGQHEVSFRHPSFGEQRRTTVVRYDVPTRLSADLR